MRALLQMERDLNALPPDALNVHSSEQSLALAEAELQQLSHELITVLSGARAPMAVAEAIADMLLQRRGFDVLPSFDEAMTHEALLLSHALNRRQAAQIVLVLVACALASDLELQGTVIEFGGEHFLQLSNEREYALLDFSDQGAVIAPAHVTAYFDQRQVLLEKGDDDSPQLLRHEFPGDLISYYHALRAVWLRLKADEHALCVSRPILELVPERAEEWALRGSLYERAGQLYAAQSDYLRYLQVAPPNHDSQRMVRERARLIAQQLARLN